MTLDDAMRSAASDGFSAGFDDDGDGVLFIDFDAMVHLFGSDRANDAWDVLASCGAPVVSLEDGGGLRVLLDGEDVTIGPREWGAVEEAVMDYRDGHGTPLSEAHALAWGLMHGGQLLTADEAVDAILALYGLGWA